MENEVTTQALRAGSHLWVERGAWAIEMLAVVLIIAFILAATLNWIYKLLAHRELIVSQYERYRERLGRSLLVGLEILVAADIVRTVVLEPTLPNVLVLGLLVVIRTFLGWSIVLEIEGRWPWQTRTRPAEGDEKI
jgi:uncharacterized membrane protein